MSLETKKLELIERLMQIKEVEILMQYENLLKQAHLQYRVEESIKAIEEGQTVTFCAFKTENKSILK